MKRLMLLLALLSMARIAGAAEDLLPRPPELEPDVQFWIRVYTQISTNEGFIHDQHKLSVVYETLHFDADTPSTSARVAWMPSASASQEILRHLAQRR